MAKPQIEICVDNWASLEVANRFEIDRIELCSALDCGGLTPPYGFIAEAVRFSRVPLAVMIRPRAGDFLYREAELQIMLRDIQIAAELGVKNVVFGALTAEGELDLNALKRLTDCAHSHHLAVTFHRAFDLCRSPELALEQLIKHGCQRLLTSGQAATAFEGIALITRLVQQAQNRIQIMAGCGIHAQNVAAIVRQTQVSHIHFSAKSTQQSLMKRTNRATMAGNNAEQDETLAVADPDKIRAILEAL